jgi:hypothetical protein
MHKKKGGVSFLDATLLVYPEQLEANRARGDAPAAVACQGRGGGQLYNRGPAVGGDVGHRRRLQRKDGMQRHVHRNGRVVGQFPALAGSRSQRSQVVCGLQSTQATRFLGRDCCARDPACWFFLAGNGHFTWKGTGALPRTDSLTLKPNCRLESEAGIWESGRLDAHGSTENLSRAMARKNLSFFCIRDRKTCREPWTSISAESPANRLWPAGLSGSTGSSLRIAIKPAERRCPVQ